MRRGRLVECGSADEVFFHPREEYTRTLLAAVRGCGGGGGGRFGSEAALPGAVADGEDFDAHALESLAVKVEFVGDFAADVDEAPGDEGAAVGDAGFAAAAVGEVGDADAAGQREGAVGGVELAFVEFLADGADAAVGFVVRGEADGAVTEGLPRCSWGCSAGRAGCRGTFCSRGSRPTAAGRS